MSPVSTNQDKGSAEENDDVDGVPFKKPLCYGCYQNLPQKHSSDKITKVERKKVHHRLCTGQNKTNLITDQKTNKLNLSFQARLQSG